tara:strand:+ start:535 stop:846 length:312 start_codon:yes stop_codon:yes gene_type:complete
MNLKEYSEDELRSIVSNYEDRKAYQCDYKKKNPPTAEQRKAYNQKHYQMRKQRDDYKETQDKYYLVQKEKKQHRARYVYYRRTNQLEKLKNKYPETYNMYVTV